jgi:plastocyanin
MNRVGGWLAAVALLSIAGCGRSAATKPSRPTPNTMLQPKIVENPGGEPDAWYRPNPIRVRVGQAITWTNNDADLHDVTADDGTFASGTLAAGGTFRWVPRRVGTYRYSCTLHPEMHGTVIVSP